MTDALTDAQATFKPTVAVRVKPSKVPAGWSTALGAVKPRVVAVTKDPQTEAPRVCVCAPFIAGPQCAWFDPDDLIVEQRLA